jgi:hypothetical protein
MNPLRTEAEAVTTSSLRRCRAVVRSSSQVRFKTYPQYSRGKRTVGHERIVFTSLFLGISIVHLGQRPGNTKRDHRITSKSDLGSDGLKPLVILRLLRTAKERKRSPS